MRMAQYSSTEFRGRRMRRPACKDLHGPPTLPTWLAIVIVVLTTVSLSCSPAAELPLKVNEPFAYGLEAHSPPTGAEPGLSDSCTRTVIVDNDCSVCIYVAQRWARGELRDSLPTRWISVSSPRDTESFREVLGPTAELLRITNWRSAPSAIRGMRLFGTPVTLVVDENGFVREQRAGFVMLGEEGREWCTTNLAGRGTASQ